MMGAARAVATAVARPALGHNNAVLVLTLTRSGGWGTLRPRRAVAPTGPPLWLGGRLTLLPSAPSRPSE